MSEEVETIKDRLDIVEIIGERVRLKKTGQHYKGLCPFHQEKTPSFIVSPGKKIWHCFGCHKGGDIFSFVQEIEQADFPEALGILASRAGVELKKQSRQSTDHRQKIFELLDLTARFYHEILTNQPTGKKSQDYLLKRGINQKSINSFRLGYAPNKWDTLQNFLRHKGFHPSEMTEAGVVGESSRGTLYDRFRGRIIFPIEDSQGRTIAFGGRITPWHETGEEGKYVNSPETKLYEKKRTIYNLHRAKQKLMQTNNCLVVEGYMDVIMLMQTGIENVVAASGTAFTPETLSLLSRFVDTVNFAFDADTAGTKASITAAKSALQAGMKVGLIVLPPDKDPADLALSSPEHLKEIINQPESLISVLVNKLKHSQGQELNDYLNELLPLINSAENPVYQGEMIQELSTILHLPEARLISHLEKTVNNNQYNLPTNNKPDQNEAFATTVSPQQLLLGMFIAYPETRNEVINQLKSEFLLAEDIKSLYNVLHGVVEKNRNLLQSSADELIGEIPEQYTPLAEALRQLGEERVAQSRGNVNKEGQAVLRVVKRQGIERQIDKLKQELVTGSSPDNQNKLEKIQKLQQERFKLSQ